MGRSFGTSHAEYKVTTPNGPRWFNTREEAYREAHSWDKHGEPRAVVFRWTGTAYREIGHR